MANFERQWALLNWLLVVSLFSVFSIVDMIFSQLGNFFYKLGNFFF